MGVLAFQIKWQVAKTNPNEHTTTLNCKSSTVGPLHKNELASFKQQIDSNPQINVSPGKNLLTFHYTGGLIPGSLFHALLL